MSKVRRLYKFYDGNRALQNLKQKRLKISTLEDLNDPFEFHGFTFPDQGSRKIWEEGRQKAFDDIGLVCFCRDWKNPVIWSHYAQNHRGLALGFDVKESDTVDVSYKEKRTPFPSLLQLPSSDLFGLLKSVFATKFRHWEYENEVRVFVNKGPKCRETGLFFKSFDENMALREVVIGPLSQISTEDVRNATGADTLTVTTSRLAFKEYTVVKQRSKKLQK